MIDTQSEALVPISEAPNLVPSRPHVGTIWRWVKRGCRGVKLETVLFGGKRYTSLEALQRFVEATTAAADGTSTVTSSTPAAARKRDERANRELDADGF